MLFTISHSTQLELKSDLLPVFLFFIYKFGILFQKQKYCYHHLEKSPENYTNSLPVSVLYSFRRSYLGQHAASINAKTKCYSVFVELHSDSFHSETRLPSLLTLTLALLCTLYGWSSISCFARCVWTVRTCLQESAPKSYRHASMLTQKFQKENNCSSYNKCSSESTITLLRL